LRSALRERARKMVFKMSARRAKMTRQKRCRDARRARVMREAFTRE